MDKRSAEAQRTNRKTPVVAARRSGLLTPMVTVTLVLMTMLAALLAGASAASAQGTVPDAPDQPTGSAVFVGGVDLEWNDVPGSDSYGVQMSRNGQWTDLPADGIEIAFYGAGAIISELEPDGSSYWFRVRAINAHGSSEWSDYNFMAPTSQYKSGRRARPDNVPADGMPIIEGTAQVGESLTADTSGIEDANGLDRVQFRFQWVSHDGSADTDIANATSSTYSVAATDVDNTIKVRVAFTDRYGYAESLTGGETAKVAAGSNSLATGQPTIIGTAQVGETLAADISGIADADGLTNASYSYQWLADSTDIAGETASTYTLVPADAGKTIKVKVKFTDDQGNEKTLTSTSTVAVAATVPGVPQNVQISLSASNALDVSWEAPASNGGSFVTGYKVQWKSGEQDYDESREATVYGHPVYSISGLRSGVLYTIRVIAMNNVGEGLPSTEVSDSPLSALDRLRRFIATDVVEAHESSHPWLRTTWDYMESGFDLRVNYSLNGGIVLSGCSYEDGLKKCRAEAMEIGPRSVNNLELLLHEMAHVFTLTNGLLDEPAPLAAAHLYIYSLEDTAEPTGFCLPSELLADILQLSVVGVSADQGTSDTIAGYWGYCNGDYDAGQADPLTEEALTVVNSALSGQMPQWFADTYHDSDGNADLEQLWSDIKSIPRKERFILAYSLRDQFGGYCGNPQVAAVLDIESSSERVSDNEIKNPWRDGGCVPEAPGGLHIVLGSNQLDLSWEAPVDDGGSSIRGYAVEWKSGYEGYDESRRTVIDDPSSNSHTVTGLTESVEHTLRVTAFNVFGDGEYAAVTMLNSPATGAPLVSGIARIGETLTASSSGIADEDGLSNPTYSYQWIRNNGTTDSVIQDATSSTHRLTDDDVGKTIKVRVSFTDDEGNSESLTSDATAVVAATVPGVPQHVRVTPNDSQALDVSWEAPASDGGSAVTGYKVQWKEATGSWDTPDDVSEAVVTGAIHTIASLTEGTAYSVRVLASNEVGDGSASAELAGTPRDITPPSLSTATVNEAVMTLTYDEALDENSVPASETFSVTAGDAATTVDSVSVSGSSVTLTLSSAVTTDVAVTVSYAVPAGQTAARIKDLAGNAVPALSSQAVVNVTEQSGNDNSALWSATMTVGVSNGLYGYESFYFSLGALSDKTITLDGSVYTLYRLAYYSSNTGSLTVVLDRALSSGFLLRLDGFEFASDDASTLNGFTGYIYSWPKGQLSWSLGDQVQVSVAQVETSDKPENIPATGLPTISGTAQVGETLTADTTGIADADGLTKVSYSYQWVANDGTADTDITDATGSTFTLAAAHEGKTVKVQVSFTDDAGNEETLTSSATAAVEAAPNTPATGAPAISGTVQVGETLTADTSGIADTDGLTNVSYNYQWVANDGSTDADIAGAADAAYTLVAADVDKTIKVRVTFTDDASNDETLTSLPTEPVAAAATESSDPDAAIKALTLTDANGASIMLTPTFDPLVDTYEASVPNGVASISVAAEFIGRVGGIQTVDTWEFTLDVGDNLIEIVVTSASGDELNRYTVTVTRADSIDRAEPEWSATLTVGTDESLVPVATGYSKWGVTGSELSTDRFAIEGETYRVKFLFNLAGGLYFTLDKELPSDFTLRIGGSEYSGRDSSIGQSRWEGNYWWGDTGFSGTPGETVEVSLSVNPAPLPAREQAPPSAYFTDMPDAHNGDDSFQFRLNTTRQVDITDVNLRDHALVVDGGSVSNVEALGDGRWLVTVEADSTDDVTISLYEATDCQEAGAICTVDGVSLNYYPVLTVPGGVTDAVTASEPPAKPTGLSAATVKHDAVTLTWDDPQDDSITGYVILRRDRAIHPIGTFVTIAGDTGSTDTTYTDDTVEPNKEYVYRIKAINEHGEASEMSPWISANTPVVPVPGKPTGLSVVVSNDTVTLTWDDPQDDSITGYVILRRDRAIHPIGTFVTLAGDTGSADTTYTDDTVEPDKEYVYRIKAINEHGKVSERSPWISANTPAG